MHVKDERDHQATELRELKQSGGGKDDGKALERAQATIKRLSADAAHSTSMQRDLATKNKKVEQLTAQLEKTKQERDYYKKEYGKKILAELNEKAGQKFPEVVNEFKDELREIAKELGLNDWEDVEDFVKVFVLKATHEDYDDAKFAYVTLNARLILEKVLGDMPLYQRMHEFLSIENGHFIHNKPRAEQEERNAHTSEYFMRIWGKDFHGSLTIVSIGK